MKTNHKLTERIMNVWVGGCVCVCVCAYVHMPTYGKHMTLSWLVAIVVGNRRCRRSHRHHRERVVVIGVSVKLGKLKTI